MLFWFWFGFGAYTTTTIHTPPYLSGSYKAQRMRYGTKEKNMRKGCFWSLVIIMDSEKDSFLSFFRILYSSHTLTPTFFHSNFKPLGSENKKEKKNRTLCFLCLTITIITKFVFEPNEWKTCIRINEHTKGNNQKNI